MPKQSSFFMSKKLQNNFSTNLNLNFHLKPFTCRFVRSLSTGLCFLDQMMIQLFSFLLSSKLFFSLVSLFLALLLKKLFLIFCTIMENFKPKLENSSYMQFILPFALHPHILISPRKVTNFQFVQFFLVLKKRMTSLENFKYWS